MIKSSYFYFSEALRNRWNPEYPFSRSNDKSLQSSSLSSSTALIELSFLSHFSTNSDGSKDAGRPWTRVRESIRSLMRGCISSTAFCSNFTASITVIKNCTVSATRTAEFEPAVSD